MVDAWLDRAIQSLHYMCKHLHEVLTFGQCILVEKETKFFLRNFIIFKIKSLFLNFDIYPHVSPNISLDPK
jgi:hypothetical protein